MTMMQHEYLSENPTFCFLYIVILENFVLVFKKIPKEKKERKKKKKGLTEVMKVIFWVSTAHSSL